MITTVGLRSFTTTNPTTAYGGRFAKTAGGTTSPELYATSWASLMLHHPSGSLTLDQAMDRSICQTWHALELKYFYRSVHNFTGARTTAVMLILLVLSVPTPSTASQHSSRPKVRTKSVRVRACARACVCVFMSESDSSIGIASH